MLASNNGLEPNARRKRPVVSCRECHRRKEKCDRRQPCTRCTRRGKRGACVYELEHARSAFVPPELDNQPTDSVTQRRSDSTSAISSAAEDEFKLLGYANDTRGTLGIVRGLGESTSLGHILRPPNDPTATQYASIVRELPSRRHIDLLVQAFFQNVAWHYDIVDEATFITQLFQWSCLSHKQLKQAPDGLPTSLQSFPALLFQVLAQALLFQPTDHDKSLDDLKYTADMKLSDRAVEYSDAGHRIASSFRKSELTLTIVQAELMRACFEKTTGAVIEAWHTLGIAIRDAQELGLHQIEPQQDLALRTESSHPDPGRKVWLILHLWDAHMAIVLGRPMSTRVNPDDVPSATPWNCSSGRPWLPQPRDVILCGYHTAYKFLQDIHDLEKMDDCRPVVDDIHETLLGNISNLPPWARTRRSRQREPLWLSAALEMMCTNLQFVLFALHRPFVFAESGSRAAAFHSATQILESQARLFDQTEPLQHKAFSFVFATFDAMVLIIAVHIRFPDEFSDHFRTTRANLEWALERLKLLQTNNQLASSAYQVVRRLYRTMLSVATPTHPLRSHRGGTGSDELAGMEAEMLHVVPDDDFPLNLGSVLLPHPLNELLYNESLSIDPASQTEPSLEPLRSQFGFFDSL